MKDYLILAVCVCTLAMSGCGFHLKGTQDKFFLNQQVWQIDGAQLQQPLVQTWQRYGGVVSPQAAIQLRVLSVSMQKDIYTITRAAKLNEYLLNLRVQAQIYRDEQAWGKPMEIHVQRALPYADSMVLGKQEEEAMIWREMQEDAAQQLIRRLRFLKD